MTFLGLVGGLGILVALGSMAPPTSYPTSEPLVQESPAPIVPTAEPVKPETARTSGASTIPVSAQETTVHLELAGDYSLISYARQGMTLALIGDMRLTRTGEARYQFETAVTNAALGSLFPVPRLHRRPRGLLDDDDPPDQRSHGGRRTDPDRRAIRRIDPRDAEHVRRQGRLEEAVGSLRRTGRAACRTGWRWLTRTPAKGCP